MTEGHLFLGAVLRPFSNHSALDQKNCQKSNNTSRQGRSAATFIRHVQNMRISLHDYQLTLSASVVTTKNVERSKLSERNDRRPAVRKPLLPHGGGGAFEAHRFEAGTRNIFSTCSAREKLNTSAGHLTGESESASGTLLAEISYRHILIGTIKNPNHMRGRCHRQRINKASIKKLTQGAAIDTQTVTRLH